MNGSIWILFHALLIAFTSRLSLANKNMHGVGRIIGGSMAKTDEYPYLASVRLHNSHLCGGSIISDSWILTAAHCADHSPKQLKVAVGSIYLDNGGTTQRVKRTIIHKKYDGDKYDIALLELAFPLDLTESVKTIKLSHTEAPADSEITILGWGNIADNGPISNTLKINKKLTKLDSKSCENRSKDIYFEGLMCLMHAKGDGACSGDSGGPAEYKGELIGVASYVIDPCGSEKPDGYVDVSHFIDWINDNTGLKL